VVDTVRGEGRRIVARLTEPHHGAHPHLAQDVEVVRRAEGPDSTRGFAEYAAAEVHQALEGDELAGDDLGSL
jgi:hypothetical protein